MSNDASPRPRRGFFGTIWWLVDGSRRLVLNLLFLAIVPVLQINGFGSQRNDCLDA